jgi:hypothetical protein
MTTEGQIVRAFNDEWLGRVETVWEAFCAASLTADTGLIGAVSPDDYDRASFRETSLSDGFRLRFDELMESYRFRLEGLALDLCRSQAALSEKSDKAR